MWPCKISLTPSKTNLQTLVLHQSPAHQKLTHFESLIHAHFCSVPFKDITFQGQTVDENLNNKEIGTFHTFDQDPSHNHMYTLVVNPGNRFVVVNNTLYTSSTADLNYEAQQSWNIRVKSTDDGTPPLSVEEDFTVTVLDVNEAPNYIGISGEKVKPSFEYSPKRKDLQSMQFNI